MPERLTIVLPTKHETKLAELGRLLVELGCDFVARPDLSDALPVEGDEATLEGAAIRKAVAACRATGMMAVADESGLEVDALGGRPGARSSHYAHERATDAENNAALLRELEEIEDTDRTARFRCVIAFASPWRSDVVVVSGECEGRIARAARGGGGFGYEPLFLVGPDSSRALVELSPEERRQTGPRERALEALRPRLAEVLERTAADVERIAG